jgi:hypothetical protein
MGQKKRTMHLLSTRTRTSNCNGVMASRRSSGAMQHDTPLPATTRATRHTARPANVVAVDDGLHAHHLILSLNDSEKVSVVIG